MSQITTSPIPRPLKPRPVALVIFLLIYLAWVGLLAWIYLAQVGAR